jgi:hypothetical protein
MYGLKFFYVLVFVFSCFNSYAQVDWLDGSKDKPVKEGEVTIVKDNKIDELIKFRSTPIPPAFEPQTEGYRVQLFFDQERKNVNDARAKFMTIKRDVDTYIDYKAPNYNLTAGNFRDQLSAEKLRAAISAEFPEAIVVKTKVYLPKSSD